MTHERSILSHISWGAPSGLVSQFPAWDVSNIQYGVPWLYGIFTIFLVQDPLHPPLEWAAHEFSTGKKNSSQIYSWWMFRGSEVLYHLSYPLEHDLSLCGRGIIYLLLFLWTLSIRNKLFDIMHLLFNIIIIALYVEFFSGDHFRRQEWWLLGERLVKVSHF